MNFVTDGIEMLGNRMTLPVYGIEYPDGMDELIAAVHSRDQTRRGWITMHAHEAAGSDFTETVRDAERITFLIPRGYGILRDPFAQFRLCFRSSRSLGATPKWIPVTEEVPLPTPEEPTPAEKERWDLMAALMEAGPESWAVATPEDLPDWYWDLEVFAMNTGSQWGKTQITHGHFVFYDGSGPRGRWSLDVEGEPKPEPEEKRMSLMSGITTENGYRKPFIEFMRRHLVEPRRNPFDLVYEWARGHECNRRDMPGCRCQQNFLKRLDQPGEWRRMLKENAGRGMGTVKDFDLDPATYGGEPAPGRAPRETPAPQPKPKPAPDPQYTPSLVKDLQRYAKETHYGTKHVDRWLRALSAIGIDTGRPPMSLEEVRINYGRFSKHRWGPVLEEMLRRNPSPPPAPVKPPEELDLPALLDLIEKTAHTVTGDQVRKAVHESAFMSLRPSLLDSKYTALPMETWLAILEWSDVDRVKYVAEKRDCDNFAIALAGQIGLRLGVNGCGIVVDYSGKHAYSCLIVHDTAKGGCYVQLVEPQSDRPVQVGDRLGRHEAYSASNGWILFA